MNRYTAFLTHFGISLIIFVFLAYLILYVWYPSLFFATDGGWEGLRIVVAVDLVLGPTLTLVVFKQGKPGLRTDLTLIGLLQAVCLVVGVWIVYTERPIAMVYNDGQFFSMSADAYAEAGVPVPDLDAYPGPYPKWIRVELPEAQEENIRANALFVDKVPLRMLSDYYEPFDLERIDVGDAYDAEELKERDAEIDAIPEFLSEHGGKFDDYVYFPFGTRYAYIFLAVDRATRNVAGLLHTPGPL